MKTEGDSDRHAEDSGTAAPREERDIVDEASEDSFPASDAPGWSTLHIGPSGKHPPQRGSRGAPAPVPDVSESETESSS